MLPPCAATKRADAAAAATSAAALLLCPLRLCTVFSGQLLPAGAGVPLLCCRPAAGLSHLQAVARQDPLCGDQGQKSRLAVRAAELPYGRCACCLLRCRCRRMTVLMTVAQALSRHYAPSSPCCIAQSSAGRAWAGQHFAASNPGLRALRPSATCHTFDEPAAVHGPDITAHEHLCEQRMLNGFGPLLTALFLLVFCQGSGGGGHGRCG